MATDTFEIPPFEVPPQKVPIRLSTKALDQAIGRIQNLLKAKNAVMIVHYYTPADIQAIADATGGCVGDSLQMARFAYEHEASTLLVAGVKFNK